MHIIQEDYPSIRVKYFPTVNEILKSMLSDGIKVLILQDFHFKKFSSLKKHNVKFVQVFHGTSDKTYNVNREIIHYDLVCLSGSKMLGDTERRGLNKRKNCIITGNLKADMVFNKQYDRDSELKKLGFDAKKKNILYAPTWIDGMGNSSFKKFGLNLPEYFPDEYQLTIKLHPNIYHYNADLVRHLREKIKERDYILLLEEKKKIYDIVPVMAASDALITDVSGVSHEYIAFLRPMIFLNNQNILRFFYGKGRKRIWVTGDKVKRIKDLPHIIRRNIESPLRYREIQEKFLKEIYDFTDGKSLERIAEAVKALL
jgi:CDP-glycerol glycerophosphotransferase (TagB/SpsB family)